MTSGDDGMDPSPDHTSAGGVSPGGAPPGEEVRILDEPADGPGELIEDRPGLDRVAAALRAGAGPVAIDAERAHGFRYSQRAYLIQLRRRGAGTWLVDPVALVPTEDQPADLTGLAAAIQDAEWVVHAATQDLPCLVEVGLVPQQLFDTELAGRLLGYPRVNLGTLVEEMFGVRLLKEHSAADWSTRPLPPEWLNYAALDVELLVELRDALADRLARAGKDEWARQEFAWLASRAEVPAEARPDPWRRTSGIHRVRSPRGLAVVAGLWQARDLIARRLDRSPGRILADTAITELAADPHPDAALVRKLPGFVRRSARRYQTNWIRAVEQAMALPADDLPPLHRPTEGPPQQARLWAARNPSAAARLNRCREALVATAATLELPVENLLTPEFLRRLAWRPPAPLDEAGVEAMLAGLGARPWQREIVVGLLTPLLGED